MTKIGKLRKRSLAFFALFGLFASLASTGAHADENAFTAELDRNQAGLDETVSLKLSVASEGAQQMSEPQFRAPDFEEVNSYTSLFTKSYYENGHIGMRTERQLTKVLKPKRIGKLRISGISVKLGGKSLTASDLIVDVTPAGAGTPPTQGYNGINAARGLGKRAGGRQIFMRAEISKDHVYKGEQVVVSYYLYQRAGARMFNTSIQKYPDLNGFLREDLEMPSPGQPLPSDQVILDGVPYTRFLLARYAAYPLQEGKLKIDPMGVKYNYFAQRSRQNGNDEDLFSNFFQQQTPQEGEAQSEPITIESMPLPQNGRPVSFSGGVGDFSVTSAVDRYEVKANEAVTLKVKVEGRGNLAAIGEPKAKWPDSVELYDSKGSAKTGRAGVGEKDFEFLLLPRTPGQLTLPPLEFSFFDPAKNTYVTRTTEPVTITVTPPAPGSQVVLPNRNAAPNAGANNKAQSPRKAADEMKPFMTQAPESSSGFQGLPGWRWIYWLCGLAFAFFVLLVASDTLKGAKDKATKLQQAKAKAHLKSFEHLHAKAKQAAQGAPWNDVTKAYELLTGAVFDALDRSYQVGARSLSREHLEEILVGDKGLSAELWSRISKLLEFAELVRYASSIGAVQEKEARAELTKWVGEGEELVQALPLTIAKK